MLTCQIWFLSLTQDTQFVFMHLRAGFRTLSAASLLVEMSARLGRPDHSILKSFGMLPNFPCCKLLCSLLWQELGKRGFFYAKGIPSGHVITYHPGLFLSPGYAILYPSAFSTTQYRCPTAGRTVTFCSTCALNTQRTGIPHDGSPPMPEDTWSSHSSVPCT